ncbi:hypothetical protein PR202_ga29771 [Eleusine coracana subsp. coracana]|uniref:Uncharacterized protein n=1 Tax=Eleusine coracana subsp. coracana TaxID=191504 RepID=A0AAV5DN05_ELECO|nr:hypothetical protein PR202_ga29771 [Eleusine coracana subsp. coracana]
MMHMVIDGQEGVREGGTRREFVWCRSGTRADATVLWEEGARRGRSGRTRGPAIVLKDRGGGVRGGGARGGRRRRLTRRRLGSEVAHGGAQGWRWQGACGGGAQGQRGSTVALGNGGREANTALGEGREVDAAALRDNPNHRRCITACLVKATYVLEDEYQTEAMMQLAPAWWESFHFRRLDYDRFAPPSGSRGHSLGASIALEVGRKMMMNKGFNLPTFVYNPPHVSFIRPAAKILHVPEKAKRVVHHGSNLAEYTMGKTIPSSQRKHMVAVFQKLSPWVPELYVHEKDVICNGFIENFELRKKVQERLPMITKSAETLAYRDLLHGSAVFGLDNKRERLHLLPSARLWKKKKSPGEEEDPHGLKQWWKPDIEAERMSSKLYSGHECWPELC